MDIFGIPLPAMLSQLLLGLVNGAFYAMLSLGLAVIFGLLNVINFAHGALFMLGAVLAWAGMEYAGLNYWVMLALSPIVVLSSLMVASAILLESALSFLGLGDPNLMTWGFLIGAGRSVIRIAWWMSVFPGLAIFVTVLALNLVGEGLSDALNPRLARRRAGGAP